MTDAPAPPPEKSPRMGTFNFKAPDALIVSLREAASAEGVTASSWARHQIETALAEVDGRVVRIPISPAVGRMLKAAIASSECDRLTFVAEAVEAASRRELEAAARLRSAGETVEPYRCQHPRPARRQVVNRIECAACGKTLRML